MVQLSMEQRCSTFTRSSKGTTNGSSVRMARCLSSDTDSCGGSKPTKKTKNKPTVFDILVIALMQGISHFLLVFIQYSYLVIFVQITVKKTHDLNTLCFYKKKKSNFMSLRFNQGRNSQGGYDPTNIIPPIKL